MKRDLSPEEDAIVYFGDCESAGPMDDMVGFLAVLCIGSRLSCEADWSQLFSLRTVSRWWSRVINAAFVANHIRDLDLLDVNNPSRLHWFDDAGCSFPSLQTLAIDSAHPLSSRVPEMITLRSLAIDGWLPAITSMEKLERLAVVDLRDRFFADNRVDVVPPCNLQTLVLMDHLLKYDIMTIPDALPSLRRLVLTTAADHFDQDPRGQRICDLLPQLEEFRWYVTYFEPYTRTLGDFLSGRF